MEIYLPSMSYQFWLLQNAYICKMSRESANNLIFCLGAAVLHVLESEKNEKSIRHRRRRDVWVRKWLRRRDTDGCCVKLLNVLRAESPNLYNNFVRMSSQDFDHLLSLVGPLIGKRHTKLRKPISAADRLTLTLRYLATGEAFRSLQYVFRIPYNTISTIIPEVLDAIFTVLKHDYMKVPSSPEEWKKIASQFTQTWNCPNCIGAIDGKHIDIVAPKNSGSIYFNYKGKHSIVLMGIADASYKFIYIDVGTNGRVSDGGVFRRTSFHSALYENKLNLPDYSPLPMRSKPVPYLLIGDDAFSMNSRLLKPVSSTNLSGIERIFNYRLSRARRVVENAFGLLSVRFRVLRTTILLNPEKTRQVTSACYALHNYLITRKSAMYMTANSVDRETNDGNVIAGEWRQFEDANTFYNLEVNRSNPTDDAKQIREEFSQYFVSEGDVPFQYLKI